MADQATCLANAKKVDPQATLCTQWICELSKDYVYKFCHCQPPNPPQDPCPYGANTPVAVISDGKICYCCCSCFAWQTPIAVPDGDPKPIETFIVGDNVLAADADLNWSAYAVEFSDGIPPGPDYGKTMFSVYFQLQAKVSSLVVTADHVFLLSDGKLRRSEFLVPGVDQLVSADGEPIPILAMEVGGWYGGVHHIATSDGIPTSVDGHLLNSKGIVTGDWALQCADIEGGKIVNGEMDTGPARAATAEFIAAHDHLEGDTFRHSVKGAEWEQARHELFKPYGKTASQVPADAMRFITEKQAQDVYKNTHQAPVSSIIGQDIVAYLFRLFQGFYPDVNFRLEWGEVMPNAYSWISYGVPFVVVNGGLVRTPGVDYSTLAVILGHEIGHLYGGAPLSGDGVYSCEGQADYAAMIGVLRGVYYVTEYYTFASAGLAGVERFFEHIDPINRKGVPGQTCDGLSIDCRIQAFTAGLNTRALPECAGGPTVTYLTVDSAVATEGAQDTASIVLTFSAPLDPDSASHPQNYTFDPPSEVLSAVPLGGTPTAVTLTSNLTPDLAYKVTVQNVMSVNGTFLKDNTATVDVSWINPDA